MDLDKQIEELANFIMAEVNGEPSRDEGAVECAIRIIKELIAEVRRLEEELKNALEQISEQQGNLDELPGENIELVLKNEALKKEIERLREIELDYQDAETGYQKVKAENEELKVEVERLKKQRDMFEGFYNKKAKFANITVERLDQAMEILDKYEDQDDEIKQFYERYWPK